MLIPVALPPGWASEGTKPLSTRSSATMRIGICSGRLLHDAGAGIARLLRAPDGGVEKRCAAQQKHQLAPSHSMTSSARVRIEGGTARPSALAVLRLTTSSKLVDW